ncbi:MAG: hypothetical protein DRQ56_06740 [Gammaproteobacteria bacterium]|nr:MAG: hypothetical protein DRQ56_06740 [Gammaproteobacteria bacterium]
MLKKGPKPPGLKSGWLSLAGPPRLFYTAYCGVTRLPEYPGDEYASNEPHDQPQGLRDSDLMKYPEMKNSGPNVHGVCMVHFMDFFVMLI